MIVEEQCVGAGGGMIGMEMGTAAAVVSVAVKIRQTQAAPLLRCSFCGYTWHPRVKEPKECPKCKNRKWGSSEANPC